jgi:hypothetical protein
LRRIAVTFTTSNRLAQGVRRPLRDTTPAVSIPRYSQIVFHAGSASVRWSK